MPKTEYQQTVYVRKKFEGKRKWIAIGYLEVSEDRETPRVILDINAKEAYALISDVADHYNWGWKQLKRWFKD